MADGVRKIEPGEKDRTFRLRVLCHCVDDALIRDGIVDESGRLNEVLYRLEYVSRKIRKCDGSALTLANWGLIDHTSSHDTW